MKSKRVVNNWSKMFIKACKLHSRIFFRETLISVIFVTLLSDTRFYINLNFLHYIHSVVDVCFRIAASFLSWFIEFPFQLKHLQLVDESAYKPLKDITIGGIILFRHIKKSQEEKEELVEPVAGKMFFIYLFLYS